MSHLPSPSLVLLDDNPRHNRRIQSWPGIQLRRPSSSSSLKSSEEWERERDRDRERAIFTSKRSPEETVGSALGKGLVLSLDTSCDTSTKTVEEGSEMLGGRGKAASAGAAWERIEPVQVSPADIAGVSPLINDDAKISPVSPISFDDSDAASPAHHFKYDRKGKGRADAPSPFERLPEEIIQQIISLVDTPTFSSLRLLNRQWRSSTHKDSHYQHHLEALGIEFLPDAQPDLLDLSHKFAQESLRRLFPAALHPAVTELRLISSTPSSSGAFPGGDTFRFEFSSNGRLLLAFSSSRLVVFDMVSQPEPIVVRECKVSRRPVSAAILDDGSILAVLNAESQVILYDLRERGIKVYKTLALENAPRTIALGPSAAVVAVAYDFGIEVYSLAEGALATDRRMVNCDAVDSLRFSADGTVLLGTTLHSRSPTTVIISAPFFAIDADLSVPTSLAQIWTTQVLFPRSSRDNSHATLLPVFPCGTEDDENSWAFTYDRVFEIFRAVRVDDLRNGHTYFPGPCERGIVPPGTLPSPNKSGNLVAAGFRGGDIYLYGIPSKSDGVQAAGGTASQTLAPQWQSLKERPHNAFICGKKVTNIRHMSGLRFVSAQDGSERLVVVASGPSSASESDLEPAEGGLITLFSFPQTPSPRRKTIVLELGVRTPDVLPDPNLSLQTHINILARRSTVIAPSTRRRPSLHVPSAIPAVPPLPTSLSTPPSASTSSPHHHTHTHNPLDPADPTEAPYSQHAPRSRTTLHRAATTSRPRPTHTYPPRAPIPQYDDRDGWIPPPPPYEEADRDPVVNAAALPPPPVVVPAGAADVMLPPSPMEVYAGVASAPPNSIPPVPAIPPGMGWAGRSRREERRLVAEQRRVERSASRSLRRAVSRRQRGGGSSTALPLPPAAAAQSGPVPPMPPTPNAPPVSLARGLSRRATRRRRRRDLETASVSVGVSEGSVVELPAGVSGVARRGTIFGRRARGREGGVGGGEAREGGEGERVGERVGGLKKEKSCLVM